MSLNMQNTELFHYSGKTSLVSKLAKSEHIQKLASIFLKDDATKEEIGKAGVDMFLSR